MFHLGHPPLAQLLQKHGSSFVPGQVVYTTGGVRFCFPKVRYVRRYERVGADVRPGRLFNWDPRGSRWLRCARKRGMNGAGLRTMSRDKRSWRCWTPGAYHLEAVPDRWSPLLDGASCVIMDPGVLLPFCCADGRALTKEEWYRHRKIWLDFLPKPADVRAEEAGMGKRGGCAQAPGLVAFASYVAAFTKAYGKLSAYYSSATQAGAREYKRDKLRSMLDQLLHEFAPRPQVRWGEG